MDEKGLFEITNREMHRGFIFVRLSAEGLGFHEFFGGSLSAIDFLVDRSPEGEIGITGG